MDLLIEHDFFDYCFHMEIMVQKIGFLMLGSVMEIVDPWKEWSWRIDGRERKGLYGKD